ncbi:MAG: hypothetical protein EBU01_15295, partial [Crocinitomicaceae bacterium]|nr:hypothetical protein [Crocinitomicaceae bacterium]
MSSEIIIPEEYLCPITLGLMVDPVVCTDGKTYERTSILGLPTSSSPLTRQPIDKTNLIPNRNLKDAIERFKKKHMISVESDMIPKEQHPVVKTIVSKNTLKLEQFEQEQQRKKAEKLMIEREQKKKREAEEFIRRQNEKQEAERLTRIVKMFNAQITHEIPYGLEQEWNGSMNSDVHLSYSFIPLGK